MRNLLLTICLLLALKTHCQKNNTIDFSIGTSLPLANFKKSDIKDLESGYAKNGRNLKLSYSKEIKNHIGIQLTLMGISNKMDNQPILKEFVTSYPNTKLVNAPTRSWKNTSVLFGVYREISFLNNRIIIIPKLQAGYSFTERPGLSISNHRDDTTIPPSENESEAASLGLLFGLNNNYVINDRLRFFVSCDFFTTSPKFNFISYSATDKNAPSQATDISYIQDIRLLMINGGCSILF